MYFDMEKNSRSPEGFFRSRFSEKGVNSKIYIPPILIHIYLAVMERNRDYMEDFER